jgi:hypothetical protein
MEEITQAFVRSKESENSFQDYWYSWRTTWHLKDTVSVIWNVQWISLHYYNKPIPFEHCIVLDLVETTSCSILVNLSNSSGNSFW